MLSGSLYHWPALSSKTSYEIDFTACLSLWNWSFCRCLRSRFERWLSTATVTKFSPEMIVANYHHAAANQMSTVCRSLTWTPRGNFRDNLGSEARRRPFAWPRQFRHANPLLISLIDCFATGWYCWCFLFTIDWSREGVIDWGWVLMNLISLSWPLKFSGCLCCLKTASDFYRRLDPVFLPDFWKKQR